MKFYHKVSLEWLNTRRLYLTASDIKKLIPFTKTGRPRTVTDESYLEVYASKITLVTPEMCESFGAAARGHLLEPYAIDEHNISTTASNELYHWDDILIADNSTELEYPLAFSPDAMNIPQTIKQSMISADNDRLADVSYIGEIKSYSPERHLKTIATESRNIEERWQIATAMAVLPSIERGILILYNPDLEDHNLSECWFSRKMLENEIETVRNICNQFNEWVQRLEAPTGSKILKRAGYITVKPSSEIYKKLSLLPGCGD